MSETILGIDPGAKRLGYAIVSLLDGAYILQDSGVVELVRYPDQPYNAFRREIIQYWAPRFPDLYDKYPIHSIISELLPVTNGNVAQRVLAATAITTCMTANYLDNNMPWDEIAASTVKKRMTGNAKATKPKIRDAVISVFPELLPRKRELTQVADEADAIAIALAGLGYTIDSNAAAPRP